FGGEFTLPPDPMITDKERVRMMISDVWKATGYRFTVHDNRPLETGHKTILWCSQGAEHKRSRKGEQEGIVHLSDTDTKHISVRVKHYKKHIPYYDVSMPEEATEIIRDNLLTSTPNSLVHQIQSLHPQVSAQQIHSAWSVMSQQLWKRDKDQLTSAKLLMEEHAEIIDVFTAVTEHGVTQVSWGVKPIAETINHGVGFPLSYCLLSTVNATIPGKRKRALEGWAEQAKAKYHLAPRHISVDKDLGEISTCQTVWPNAKVSICWWHQRKAVRERLEKSKLLTTPYDARAAREIFPVINLCFLPPGRSDPGELEGSREGGGRDTTTEELVRQEKKPARMLKSSLDIQSHLSLTIPSVAKSQITQNLTQNPLKIHLPASQPKPFDIPLSQRPLNEIKTSPRVFCPPELREAIIAKMDSHRHAHPLIPGCAEPSPEGIYNWAVKRMYTFCVQHDLRELWAYLWGNWYRPERWRLWSRAPSPEIPRLRTTMINESHWRHIKHGFLHYFHKPRIDLLIWILITKLTPTFERKLENLTVDKGRYHGLASWRKTFKREWRKLEKTPLTSPMPSEYRPCIKRWALEPVPDKFFLEVIRIRTAPFWQHSSLIPKAKLPEGYLDDELPLIDVPSDEQQESVAQNEPEDGNESEEDEELYGIEAGNIGTYEERIDTLVRNLHSFANGLLYQKQFRDGRFLNIVKKQGSGFLRLLDTCLEKERRQNLNGTAPISTWDNRASSAMFYRTRPQGHEGA
ncbi:hypothetical protein DFH05DRAFT_1396638, partial [Lentinula detonsa]